MFGLKLTRRIPCALSLATKALLTSVIRREKGLPVVADGQRVAPQVRVIDQRPHDDLAGKVHGPVIVAHHDCGLDHARRVEARPKADRIGLVRESQIGRVPLTHPNPADFPAPGLPILSEWVR